MCNEDKGGQNPPFLFHLGDHMKAIRLVLFLMICSYPAMGQQVSPLTNECGPKCDGGFTVSNLGLTPIIVTVTTESFTPGPSGGISRPLDSSAHVDLDSTSTRISPKGSYTFGYKIHCDQLPCQIRFRPSMVAGKTAQGLQVRMVLGHAVYLCSKAHNCRMKTLQATGVIQAKAKN